MTTQDYLHGYDLAEQERLVAQAEYWSETLIPLGLEYRAGQRLLEIGCGAGAVLGVLDRTFPGLELAGIDLEPRQIEFARAHLTRLGRPAADLRVGDAAALPWEDASFDHVYVMWVLEHLRDPMPLLREAYRVLKPGGTIALTETDNATFLAHPSTPAWELVVRAQYEHFARYGNPIAGRRQGNYLLQAGFAEVENRLAGFHFFQDGTDRLQAHVAYCAEFLGLALEPMARKLSYPPGELRQGVEDLRAVAVSSDGAMNQVVFRGLGRRPPAAPDQRPL